MKGGGEEKNCGQCTQRYGGNGIKPRIFDEVFNAELKEKVKFSARIGNAHRQQ